MIDIDYLLFKTESELFEALADYNFGSGTVIALTPIGAYQVSIVCPNIPFQDYYYKAYVIKNSDILAVHYIYSQEQIAEDFPQEDREDVLYLLDEYFSKTLRDPYTRTDINHTLYGIDSDDDEQAEKVLQPEPLLFSYGRSRCQSPIQRHNGVDIDKMMQELREDDINRPEF